MLRLAFKQKSRPPRAALPERTGVSTSRARHGESYYTSQMDGGGSGDPCLHPLTRTAAVPKRRELRASDWLHRSHSQANDRQDEGPWLEHRTTMEAEWIPSEQRLPPPAAIGRRGERALLREGSGARTTRAEGQGREVRGVSGVRTVEADAEAIQGRAGMVLLRLRGKTETPSTPHHIQEYRQRASGRPRPPLQETPLALPCVDRVGEGDARNRPHRPCECPELTPFAMTRSSALPWSEGCASGTECASQVMRRSLLTPGCHQGRSRDASHDLRKRGRSSDWRLSRVGSGSSLASGGSVVEYAVSRTVPQRLRPEPKEHSLFPSGRVPKRGTSAGARSGRGS